MTIPGFIVRNALRNKRRLALTVLSVAMSLFLFTTVQTALRELTQPAVSEDAALRLAVRHRVSLANLLPARYQRRIESLPGIVECMKMSWFGGIYKDEKNFFPQFGVDADRLFTVFSEASIDPGQLQAFLKDKAGAVVGHKTMDRFGWKVGDKITLKGTIYPCDLELTIHGEYTGGIDETNLFFHHDYLDEAMNRFGKVGTFWIRAENAAVIPGLIERIDGIFANTDAETKTETERAFQLGFISMFGDIKLILGSVSLVVVFTMILVTASTMSMAIRERTREIAVLKAIGFDGWKVSTLILAEAFGLAMAGGAIGCGFARLLFSNVDVYSFSNGFFIKFEVTAHILATGMLIAVALGLISAAMPIWSCLRSSVLEGLRELD
jgi:putative ABC transport system permease protein